MITGIIHSAKALDEKQLSLIAEKFEKLLGDSVRFDVNIDESLLGGILVDIGGRVYDGSLKGQLNQVLKALKDQGRE